MTNLYLFDVDGTLVDATNAHLDAYGKAYKTVFDIDIPKETLLKRFGKTEIEIHRGACEELRINYNKSQLEKISELGARNIREIISEDNVRVMPGVLECLNDLRKRVIVGVITGNTKPVGEALLKAGELYDYFSIYSYGDNASKRVEILRDAIKQASDKRYELNRITVIGDSPFDIEAGKLISAFTVGVATGYYNEDKLKSAGADIVLSSLLEYKKIPFL